MGILTRKAIKEAIGNGQIHISPYEEKQLNTNSYDLRLGKEVKVYASWTRFTHSGDFEKLDYDLIKTMDLKEEQHTFSRSIDNHGFVLEPGVFYLMHTHERVCSNHFVPVLDGKSSIARAGIKIHFTAGYGDLGFNGQYTLEVEAAGPVKVYAGMRIAQIRFHEVCGEREDYKTKGHYVDNAAKGAVASRVHQQLAEDDV